MKMYSCPMHPEIKSHSKGTCSICGMDLVESGKMVHHKREGFISTYAPLLIILALIIVTVGVISLKDNLTNPFSWEVSSGYFMAAFFLVFGGFKLLDLKGFASGYKTYDLLAQRVPQYGYVYPFIEIILGFSYILTPGSFVLNIATLFIMGFSGIGVALKLLRKERFQCVCLGTIIKVPLTKVTLVEDFGMALMALMMIL